MWFRNELSSLAEVSLYLSLNSGQHPERIKRFSIETYKEITFRLTNVIPERIIFLIRGITVFILWACHELAVCRVRMSWQHFGLNFGICILLEIWTCLGVITQTETTVLVVIKSTEFSSILARDLKSGVVVDIPPTFTLQAFSLSSHNQNPLTNNHRPKMPHKSDHLF